jgi:hypothetical protein
MNGLPTFPPPSYPEIASVPKASPVRSPFLGLTSEGGGLNDGLWQSGILLGFLWFDIIKFQRPEGVVASATNA